MLLVSQRVAYFVIQLSAYITIQSPYCLLVLCRPAELASRQHGGGCYTPTSNSKYWFTTSFLQGGRCRKAVLGVCADLWRNSVQGTSLLPPKAFVGSAELFPFPTVPPLFGLPSRVAFCLSFTCVRVSNANHTRTRARARAHTHTHTHTHTLTHTRTRTHARTHARTDAHARTHTHT